MDSATFCSPELPLLHPNMAARPWQLPQGCLCCRVKTERQKGGLRLTSDHAPSVCGGSKALVTLGVLEGEEALRGREWTRMRTAAPSEVREAQGSHVRGAAPCRSLREAAGAPAEAAPLGMGAGEQGTLGRGLGTRQTTGNPSKH